MTCCETKSNALIAYATPLLVADDDAARLLGIGVSYFREMLKAGRIGPEPVRLGRRQLHRVDELQRWVEAGLPERAAWQASKEGGGNG